MDGFLPADNVKISGIRKWTPDKLFQVLLDMPDNTVLFLSPLYIIVVQKIFSSWKFSFRMVDRLMFLYEKNLK